MLFEGPWTKNVRMSGDFLFRRSEYYVRLVLRPGRQRRIMYFTWTDNLNTGITEIDHQHQQIAHHVNTLHDARQTGDHRAIGEVIQGLVDYTISHFSFEEQLLEEVGFPYVRAHQRVHELFGKRIAEYRVRHGEGEPVADELVALLKHWLTHHIETEDWNYLASVNQALEHEQRKPWVAGLVQKVFG